MRLRPPGMPADPDEQPEPDDLPPGESEERAGAGSSGRGRPAAGEGIKPDRPERARAASGEEPGYPDEEPGYPDEEPWDTEESDAGELERDAEGRVRVRFRAARFRAVLSLAGALVALLIALPGGDSARRLAALVAAVGLIVFGVRELLVPVRLAADPDGVTVVVGYAGHRRLPWAQVERVRVDVRSRLGLRSQLLEIDVGETLYLFSQGELGMPCARAVDLVRRVRLDG